MLHNYRYREEVILKLIHIHNNFFNNNKQNTSKFKLISLIKLIKYN